jgi:hypothetical protein
MLHPLLASPTHATLPALHLIIILIVGNGKFVLYFTKHHTMETYGQWRYSFTIVNLDPDALPLGKKLPLPNR